MINLFVEDYYVVNEKLFVFHDIKVTRLASTQSQLISKRDNGGVNCHSVEYSRRLLPRFKYITQPRFELILERVFSSFSQVIFARKRSSPRETTTTTKE